MSVTSPVVRRRISAATATEAVHICEALVRYVDDHLGQLTHIVDRARSLVTIASAPPKPIRPRSRAARGTRRVDA